MEFEMNHASSPVRPARSTFSAKPRTPRAPDSQFRTGPSRRLAVSALVAVALSVTFAQSRVLTKAVTDVDPLKYERGFLLTGNFVVGGVDLTPQNNPADPNGLATGEIVMSGVPANAEIAAAYLYWEAIYAPGANPLTGVAFRGSPLAASRITARTMALPARTAACWGAAANTLNPTITVFRADVLDLLPKLYDADNTWTGKRIVNSSDLAPSPTANLDLQGNTYPPHTVTLPETTGDLAIQSAGATLVVIYRDPNAPLTKIVLYDGNAPYHPTLSDAKLSQRVRGFYQHTGNTGKLALLGGTGGNNQTERIFFNGSQLPLVDPFPQTSPSSDRSWANPVSPSPLSMAGTTTDAGYGETVTVGFDHQNPSPDDCFALAAAVFSIPVLDADGDGEPDGLESSSTIGNPPSPWKNPDGQLLPDLHAMGAAPNRKDLFAEINALKTDVALTYGSQDAPYNSANPAESVVQVQAHTHTPPPDVFKMLGDVYKSHNITPHFDVGSTASYLGQECTFNPATQQWSPHPACEYLVPTSLARGGETITEQYCNAPDCEFPAFPGTVGFKFGLQRYRGAPVDDDGKELTTDAQLQAWNAVAGTYTDPSGTYRFTMHRRRFDPLRKPFFHYLLYAHALGIRKSLPCVANGQPAPYPPDTTTCAAGTDNPYFVAADYHVPASRSGVADQPGGNALITLGLWDKIFGTGTTFVQASTTLHELGHNLDLTHGGTATIWGDKKANTTTYYEPNCKPNYLSSMSYLFQVFGLVDPNFEVHLDYSGAVHNAFDSPVNENSLIDGALNPTPPYRPTWFAPATSSLASILGVAAYPATKFCNAVKFGSAPPAPLMVRVWAPALSSTTFDWDVPFDWNGDGVDPTTVSSNVNFDGVFGGAQVTSSALYGFDDVAHLRLDQIGAGRRIVQFSPGHTGDVSADGGDVSADGGDVSADGGDVSADGGDVSADGGDVSADGGDVSADGGDVSADGGDVSADGGDVSADGGDDLDAQSARDMGRTPPNAARACVLGSDCTNLPEGLSQPQPYDPQYHSVLVRWKAPNDGHVKVFTVWRIYGDAINPQTVAAAVQVGSDVSGTQLYQIDSEELPDGKKFTYFVKAEFDDDTVNKFSGASNFTTITALNDAPLAVDDPSYVTTVGTQLTVAPPAILGNDKDDDTFDTSVFKVFSYTQPANGSVTVSLTGSFTYTPNKNFVGTDTFTYRADDGYWPRDTSVKLSPPSNIATVTITVKKKGNQ